METWQPVLLALAAMIAFLLVLVASVAAVMHFQPRSFTERLRNLRHK